MCGNSRMLMSKSYQSVACFELANFDLYFKVQSYYLSSLDLYQLKGIILFIGTIEPNSVAWDK